ncbi:MAG: metal-dependent phosphohydrolase [Planctomycetota bacterium]|nr:MAG: metal-dependent phosphohydrolase [Planctomycetota bacterium]
MRKRRPKTQREFALSVVQRLRDAGFEALWAGGCVRDQLLGRTPKDYDVATNALPEQVRELFGFRRTLAIGAAFGVISVRGGNLKSIDVATFRTDGRYQDGRRPESVEFTSAEEDARRRDFTINGLFCDPIADRIIDYVGGVNDLEARVVRAIGDPRQRFAEDKLRMLRAVRFAATYNFALDPATLAAIREMAGDVLQVSAERIGAELRRMLAHASRSRGAALLAESGLMRAVLPEIAPLAEANDERWQAAERRMRKIGNSTVACGFASLLFGMADARQAQAIGRRLRLTNKENHRIGWLLAQLPAALEGDQLPWPQLQRLLVHDGFGELSALAQSVLPADHPALRRCQAQLARPAGEWNPPPLVTGDDLTAWGYQAGQRFAALLGHLRDEQLEGRLRTKEDAMAEAQRWMAARGEEPLR